MKPKFVQLLFITFILFGTSCQKDDDNDNGVSNLTATVYNSQYVELNWTFELNALSSSYLVEIYQDKISGDPVFSTTVYAYDLPYQCSEKLEANSKYLIRVKETSSEQTTSNSNWSQTKISTSELVGNWVQVTYFSGLDRAMATAGAMGNYGYVFGGYNYSSNERLNDLWTYNPETNTWYQCASLPGAARSGAASFSINNIIYVGCGYDGTNGVRLKDFYAYDPESNAWTAIADFGKGVDDDMLGREGMIAFSINNIGYVGTGADATGNEYADLYAYDPETNEWTQKADLPISARKNAVAFVIDGIAYVCTGTLDGEFVDDFSKYDPTTDSWTKLRRISNFSGNTYDDYYKIIRNNAVAFASGGKGYVATGGQNTSGADVWEYDPSEDLWTQKSDLEGTARYGAVAFTVDDKGYVLTGFKGSSMSLDDVWRFEPDDGYSTED